MPKVAFCVNLLKIDDIAESTLMLIINIIFCRRMVVNKRPSMQSQFLVFVYTTRQALLGYDFQLDPNYPLTQKIIHFNIFLRFDKVTTAMDFWRLIVIHYSRTDEGILDFRLEWREPYYPPSTNIHFRVRMRSIIVGSQ